MHPYLLGADRNIWLTNWILRYEFQRVLDSAEEDQHIRASYPLLGLCVQVCCAIMLCYATMSTNSYEG